MSIFEAIHNYFSFKDLTPTDFNLHLITSIGHVCGNHFVKLHLNYAHLI